MHLPINQPLVLAELAVLLRDKVRPAISDRAALDLLDAAADTARRLAMEAGHGDPPAQDDAGTAEAAASALAGAVTRGDAALLHDLLEKERPQLEARESIFEALREQRTPPEAGAAAPDGATITAWLRERFPDDPGVQAVDARLVVGGNSKQSIAFDRVGSDGRREPLLMRRDLPNASNGKTVADEYPVLQALARAGVHAPAPVCLETESRALPGPFIVVRRVEGQTLGSHEGPAPDAPGDPLDMMAATLAALHAVPVGGLDLPGYAAGLSGPAEARGAVERFRRQDANLWDVREPILQAAFDWLDREAALSIQPVVIAHGDFGFHNLYLTADGPMLLDWEMAHPGAAAEDLTRAGDGLGSLGTVEDFIARYAAHGGAVPPAASLAYYDVFRLVRSTVNYRCAVKLFNDGRNPSIRKLNATATLYVKNLRRIADILMAAGD